MPEQRIPYLTVYHVALYRSAPTGEPRRSEFYVIDVEPLYAAGVRQPGKWIVKEQHGFWNEREQRAECIATTLRPTATEHACDLEGASAKATGQTGHRASEGFAYAPQLDPADPRRHIQYRADRSGNLWPS